MFVDPEAFGDTDGDGFREVKKDILLQALDEYNFGSVSLPLATYFDDSFNAAPFLHKLEGIPEELSQAIRKNDLAAAGDYFADLAATSENPLRDIANPLAKHLAGTATYGGYMENVDINNESGFSVTSDGRMRFNCVAFFQLAFQDLAKVPGLKLQAVILEIEPGSPMNMGTGKGISTNNIRNIENQTSSYNFDFDDFDGLLNEEPASHIVLLASDAAGHHLIVDNTSVIYLNNEDPKKFITDKYQKDFPYISYK